MSKLPQIDPSDDEQLVVQAARLKCLRSLLEKGQGNELLKNASTITVRSTSQVHEPKLTASVRHDAGVSPDARPIEPVTPVTIGPDSCE